jgi:hypothetical protein
LSFVAAAASPAATSLAALDADEFAESRSAWMLASAEADPLESAVEVLVGAIAAGVVAATG